MPILFSLCAVCRGARGGMCLVGRRNRRHHVYTISRLFIGNGGIGNHFCRFISAFVRLWSRQACSVACKLALVISVCVQKLMTNIRCFGGESVAGLHARQRGKWKQTSAPFSLSQRKITKLFVQWLSDYCHKLVFHVTINREFSKSFHLTAQVYCIYRWCPEFNWYEDNKIEFECVYLWFIQAKRKDAIVIKLNRNAAGIFYVIKFCVI